MSSPEIAQDTVRLARHLPRDAWTVCTTVDISIDTLCQRVAKSLQLTKGILEELRDAHITQVLFPGRYDLGGRQLLQNGDVAHIAGAELRREPIECPACVLMTVAVVDDGSGHGLAEFSR